jgi:hypothetical protein
LPPYNRIATADSAGLNHTAQKPAPPANRFLKTLSNLIHLITRRTRFRDFQQRFADAQSATNGQLSKHDAARRDIFFDASRVNAKLFQRFGVHQQNLPAAAVPSVKAVAKSFVFDRDDLAEFADGLSTRHALKQAKNFSHDSFLRR